MFRRSTDWYSEPSRDSTYFSSHVPTSVMALLAAPGLIFLAANFHFNVSISSYLLPILYIIGCPMIWYFYASRKNTQFLDNSEFYMILERAKERLGITKPIHVYLSTEKKTLLTYAQQPFRRGLQVTLKTAEKIVSQPKEGEIVLAHELALLKREHLWLTFLRNFGAILYAMITEGALFFTFIESLVPLVLSVPAWILASFITYPWGIGLIIWYRRKSAAEYEIESAYGSNPHIALYHVFATKNMSDAGRRYYLDQIKSNIDIRKSRSILVSFFLPILVSLVVLVTTHSIFTILSTPTFIIDYAVLLLGGISFTFGVYRYESKGAGRLKQPDFPEALQVSSDDELSVEIKKRLSEKLGRDDFMLTYHTEEMMMEYGEELSVIEVNIEGSYLWVDQDEIDELNDPELVASLLYGSYIDNISGISVWYYFYCILAFAVLFFGGVLYWLLLTSRPSLPIILWIIFSITIGGVMGMVLGTFSDRKRTAAMIAMVENNQNYSVAAKKLVSGSEISNWRKHDLKRNLRRISRPVQQ